MRPNTAPTRGGATGRPRTCTGCSFQGSRTPTTCPERSFLKHPLNTSGRPASADVRDSAGDRRLTVLRTLVALFVVMGLGALLRRRGLVGADGARSLARLVADVAFPALCLRGLAELGAEALLRGWVVVLLGFATLVVSAGVGEATGRALGVGKGALPSVVFGVTMGNWIFFPLPIAEALHGSEGAGVVLLHNAGAQLYLWTFGVGRLVGRGAREGARAIATNPGSGPRSPVSCSRPPGRAPPTRRSWATCSGGSGASRCRSRRSPWARSSRARRRARWISGSGRGAAGSARSGRSCSAASWRRPSSSPRCSTRCCARAYRAARVPRRCSWRACRSRSPPERSSPAPAAPTRRGRSRAPSS